MASTFRTPDTKAKLDEIGPVKWVLFFKSVLSFWRPPDTSLAWTQSIISISVSHAVPEVFLLDTDPSPGEFKRAYPEAKLLSVQAAIEKNKEGLSWAGCAPFSSSAPCGA
jgi:hypothetical protein